MNVQFYVLRAAVTTVAISAVVACQDDSPGGSVTRMQRSTDVSIVDNARPGNGTRLGWQVGSEPSVSIGKLEGEDAHMLFAATDATRLSDGRIVVVNVGSELRVFDGAGIPADTWGGRGDGPGEFRTPVSQIARLPDDSVIVWSPQFPFLSVFDPTGDPARQVQVLKRQPDRPGDAVVPVAVLRDGSILAGPVLGFERGDSVVVELRDATGAFTSSLGTHPGLERHLDAETRTIYGVIFGRSLMMEPWGNRIVVSPTNRYEIKVFAQDGSLAQVIRRDHVMREPSAAHVEGFIEARISQLADQEAQERRRSGYESVPVGRYLPAFGTVIADALDYLWVEEYEPPGEELLGVLWSVFDTDGQVLGFVETPERLEVYEIGEHYVLGRIVDELGVEYIQVWPLERSDG